jgi:FkbM family methyltransferase
LNGLENVRLANWAAGDRAGTVPMLLGTHNSGGSKIAAGNSGHFEFAYDQPRRVDVEMRSIDANYGEERFEFVVIDTEGAESLVLKGMPRVLATAEVLQLEISALHLEHLAQISPQELVAPLAALFDYAQVDNEVFAPVPNSAFGAMAAKICEGRPHRDVLFFKADRLDRLRQAMSA